ncbi:MAG: polysaccharide deacetylase family protein [Bacteroidales bacterium]|nr:polysaccharide deacetylase family protein [Bacteroidales bacterium]
MYFVKTPISARWIYPSCIWKIKVKSPTIFLTFDDGPDPDLTYEVLALLDRFKAKATFFCVGENAAKHPEVIEESKRRGHNIGNHSMNHLKGKDTETGDYIANMKKSKSVLQTNLLRPPYGSITKKQINLLAKENRIIMWSVLPGDFDKTVTQETVLQRAIKNTNPGDIIVFHDNIKFREKMLFALEGFLSHFSSKGYNFAALTEDLINRQK